MTTSEFPYPYKDKIEVNSNYLEIIPTSETEEVVTKGGVSVTLSPKENLSSKSDRCIYYKLPYYDQIAKNVAYDEASIIQGNYTALTERRYTITEVAQRIPFILNIENNLDRVLRSEGTVLERRVGNENEREMIEQQQYQEFSTVTIPPGSEKSFEIYPLSMDDIRNIDVADIFLYDLPTSINQAGEIEMKQNFEWSFDIKFSTRSDSVEVDVNKVWIMDKYQNTIAEEQNRGDYKCHESERTY